MTTTAAEWRRNRQTHRWVTLNGEDYACNDCDTKTGSQPCPGDANDWAEAQAQEVDLLGSKAELGEADQLTDYGRANYAYRPDKETR